MTTQPAIATQPAAPGHTIERANYARDAWPIAAKWSVAELAAHTPAKVATPGSVQELRDLLAQARAEGFKVLAWGAGSGVCGAAVAASGRATLALDMRALKQIIDFDPDGMTVTVGAGLMGGELEEWLNVRGYTCGHYPQSLYLSTVGGWLATRGTGTYSNQHGGIEQLVHAIEVMLADGTVLKLGGAPRSAAGPRLLELFIGSEGTLGIITQVTLKIFAQPEQQVFAAYRCANLADGLASVRQMIARRCTPTLIRLYDETESVHLYQAAEVDPAGCLLILGSSGHAELVAAESRAAEAIVLAGGVQALGPAIGEAWNRGRYHAAWLDANRAPEVIADSIEVSASWPAILPLYQEVMQAIAPYATTRMAHLSHFYSTGTMIYFIFSIDDADPASLRARYEQIWHIVTQAALRHGGTCTHHHGVGLARRDALEQELGPRTVELLRGIKTLLDPDQLLNPGKLVFA